MNKRNSSRCNSSCTSLLQEIDQKWSIFFFYGYAHSLTQHTTHLLYILPTYRLHFHSLITYLLTYYHYLHALIVYKGLHVLTLMATCSQATRLLTHTFSKHEKKKKQQAVTLTVF